MRDSSIADIKIGVLDLQGDVSEHVVAFSRTLTKMGAAVPVVRIRSVRDLESCDALVIPGGESTTISRLIDKNHMRDSIRDFEGGIFATCAGMVLLASEVDDPRVEPLSLIDISVVRNAFGRQINSFEADIDISGLEEPFHAIFIRAPVATGAGKEVNVLARIDAGIVAAAQGRHMVFSFHPELGGDYRLHRMFLENILKN